MKITQNCQISEPNSADLCTMIFNGIYLYNILLFVFQWISFLLQPRSMSLVNSFDHFTDLGDTLCAIGVKESAAANEAFTKFGDYHRQMEKVGIHMLKKTKRVCM